MKNKQNTFMYRINFGLLHTPRTLRSACTEKSLLIANSTVFSFIKSSVFAVSQAGYYVQFQECPWQAHDEALSVGCPEAGGGGGKGWKEGEGKAKVGRSQYLARDARESANCFLIRPPPHR